MSVTPGVRLMAAVETFPSVLEGVVDSDGIIVPVSPSEAVTPAGRGADPGVAMDVVVATDVVVDMDVVVDIDVVKAPPPPSFADLGLPDRLVATLAATGIRQTFPIQAAAIPDALAGRDILARGQTGSGKTLAFGLPMLAKMAAGKRSRPHHPRGLILVPTRELAMQVADALTPLGRGLGVSMQTAVGGVRYDRQTAALRRGVDVIVATPGRLADLIDRRACSLDEVAVTVLDEADQMADMGFLPDVTELLRLTPAAGQRLLFSATLDGDVDTSSRSS